MNRKEFLKPYRKYDLDFKRLNRWYLASLYSYDSTATMLELNMPQDRSTADKVYYKEKYLIEHHPSNLKRKYEKAYAKFLEEMTIIRLISIIELHLLDVVRTAFYHDKTCFYAPKETIEFQLSEFLSKDMHDLEEKFIENKIGNLHRQGFSEIKKFYNKTFNINFDHFSTNIDSVPYTIKDINKIHDIRHLLVHRLGLTDEKFKREYSYAHKLIQLEEETVLLYLQLVNEFVSFLKNKFIEKWFSQ
ncbi:hypothetical protein [Planomicrobium sp. Y74]|uniref:hypothetical protein n=1 Tax=Planomicrobium sp. Y74 TaxID=2478977 RepID=UPI000EF51086|nr:hypothetical protein [Planomicrobium sp. Y74]RLQ92117.1 hypothetical protein D9754_04855 [Planomicrobium sp. Y74]